MVSLIKDTVTTSQLKRHLSLEGAASMPLDIVMRSLVILAICIMSSKMGGNSLVSFRRFIYLFLITLFISQGNYDISKMHYEGPGDVPGAPGGGYGYAIRTQGKSSADPPPETKEEESKMESEPTVES
jgi:hypothetical protein